MLYQGVSFASTVVFFLFALQTTKLHAVKNNMTTQPQTKLQIQQGINNNDKDEDIFSYHIPRLAAQSDSITNMSHEEQLQIIKEIKDKLRSKSWIYSDASKQIPFTDYELALIQMGPEPTLDSKGNYRKMIHSRDSKIYRAMAEVAIIHCVLGSLESYAQRLKFELHQSQGNKVHWWQTPSFLRSLTGTLPFLFHRFEVVTKNRDDIADSKVDVDIEQGKQNDDEHGGIALVLGAGNQSNLALLDVLHCIFVYPRKPVLLKHHPLRPFLDYPYKEILYPLIQRNLVHIFHDQGNDFTKKLLLQKEVSHVHLTGSKATSDVITKIYSQSRPHLHPEEVKSRITSELGCASPVIITPSERYTLQELRNCAKHILTSKKMYGGSNCLMSQVIILSSEWKQKHLFREILREEMALTPTDPCYYPGSLDKVQDIVARYDKKNVEQVEGPMIKRSYFCSKECNDNDKNTTNDDKHHPYLIECGLFGSDQYNGYALKTEAFGPLLAIVELPSNINNDETTSNDANDDDTGIGYLVNSAVPFVNNKENIFGTLSCILMHPTRSQFSYKTYQNMIKEEVISKLNYGTVNVNTHAWMGFFASSRGGQWSAHLKDVHGQSGNGFVGNGYMLKNVEKTIVYGQSLSFPFIMVQKKYLLPSFCFDIMKNALLFLSRFK